ncbi:MAG: S1 RNA-binding domain-containing protein, partial [Clostridia bacterium]|nr:S1 RNA-binding domain-containing protein [Clostridia bacterium]
LRALSAERKIEALYKVMYMQDKVGLEFDACVTGVSEHGLFVTPENTCEGLIPLSSLGMGYLYDEASISIRRQGIVYTVGTPVRVRLEEADISLVRLRYSLITDDYDNSSLQNKEVSRKDGER